MSVEVYRDSSIIGYYLEDKHYYEILHPTHMYQNGQVYDETTPAYMIVPGPFANSVVMYSNVFLFTRVDSRLNLYIKLAPDLTIYGLPGFSYDYLKADTSKDDSSYPSLLMVSTHKFNLYVKPGEEEVRFTEPNNPDNILFKYKDMRYEGSKENHGTVVLRKQDGRGYDNYGDSSYNGYGRLYHWNVGYGRKAGTEELNDRFDKDGKLTDQWVNSRGWFYIGNLYKDIEWSENEYDYDGHLYIGGMAFFDGPLAEVHYKNGAHAIPMDVVIPGLKNLLTYFPWAIRKKETWQSLNRDGGSLQSMENNIWRDRKNWP